ncbi:MAG: family 78 glycoside hydrolase catalytic domain [Clostridia bacterium]|nr:family 78 glycoside hydrolase catalytic domain [Clostridia bacterium]
MFEKSHFIKPNIQFDKKCLTYAPMFRRRFHINKPIKSASLSVCGLGYGYYWLNEEAVTKDLFTAPVSNYCKTLWYNKYDITNLIHQGENIFAVMCGNGWYNEGIETAWDFDSALWRDVPKFILSLEINGEVELISDDNWLYTLDSPVIFNQLRQGEHFDSRLYDENWKSIQFDDSKWEKAQIDDTPPSGIFRECTCEPIREVEEIEPQKIINTGRNRYVFDFGKNLSGYGRLTISQNSGDKIILRYAEQIHEEDGTLRFNDMDNPHFYKNGVFQTDEFICCGKEFRWSPKFTYHGFRYVEVSGLEKASSQTLKAIVVHQNVKKRSKFNCSNPLLNKLFEIGQQATLSNMFYMPTDCPTREKLGWMNDAQSSAEQFLTNFELEKVLAKWWVDICDAMTDDGMLPGIVPTSGWGYEWGNGPVSEGTLFEIPYKIFLHTGDDSLLRKGLPYFKKSIAFWNSQKNQNGDILYGLDDWAAPVPDEEKVDTRFINRVLKIKCLKILLTAAERCGEETSAINEEIQKDISQFKEIYLNSDGSCTLNKQTAVAMTIYFDLYDDLAPLAAQLARLVEENDFHHACGMVGLRYLYIALNKCGLQEYAYKIITSKGFPSYSDWVTNGATALYEYWDMTTSKNHHMYSDFMSWMIKTILGISPNSLKPGFEEVHISPYFFSDLSFSEGYCETVKGKISVIWERKFDVIKLEIEIPEEINAYYKSKKLLTGINTFTEPSK